MESKCELVRTGRQKIKGKASVEWYKYSTPVYYCLGYIDMMTDEVLSECQRCKNHVSRAYDDLLKWMVRQAKKGSVTNDKTD